MNLRRFDGTLGQPWNNSTSFSFKTISIVVWETNVLFHPSDGQSFSSIGPTESRGPSLCPSPPPSSSHWQSTSSPPALTPTSSRSTRTRRRRELRLPRHDPHHSPRQMGRFLPHHKPPPVPKRDRRRPLQRERASQPNRLQTVFNRRLARRRHLCCREPRE